jgi:electron transfer flavoprotein beta subunit
MNPPTVIVCIKTVPDPEGPASAFEVRTDEKRVVPVGIPPVINPYDENALEVAARLKDQWGGRVMAVNVSEKAITPVLKKSLSVGADELILVEDPAFKDLTSGSTAQVLSAAIRRMGSYDLVLTGRSASDWDSGQTGLFLAEMLRIPAVNLVQAVRMEEGRIVVEKLKRVGYDIVAAPLPALLTVSNEAGDLRWPSVKAVQEARKKPVTVWRLGDLGIEAGLLKYRNLSSLTRPASGSRTCLLIEGTSARERGENLALRLRQDKVL